MSDNQALTLTLPDERLAVMQEYIPAPIREGYQWQREENRAAAVEQAESIWHSIRFGLKNQITLSTEKMLDSYNKDRVDRVFDLIFQTTQYEGHYFHNTLNTMNQDIDRAHYWHYSPLFNYKESIPLQALRALSILKDNNITPDRWWIATMERYTTRLPSGDPLLSISFDKWFVSIAYWV